MKSKEKSVDSVFSKIKRFLTEPTKESKRLKEQLAELEEEYKAKLRIARNGERVFNRLILNLRKKEREQIFHFVAMIRSQKESYDRQIYVQQHIKLRKMWYFWFGWAGATAFIMTIKIILIFFFGVGK